MVQCKKLDSATADCRRATVADDNLNTRPERMEETPKERHYTRAEHGTPTLLCSETKVRPLQSHDSDSTSQDGKRRRLRREETW